MSELRIAKRYAKSLLDLSVEQNSLDKTYKDLELILKVYRENRELSAVLRSPIVKFDKKRSILQAIFKGKVGELTLLFLNLICNKNRAAHLRAIAREFMVEYREHKGIQTASITTAVVLSQDMKEEILKIVKDISGKNSIELEEKIDEDIIGGYILKVGDKQINDSIRGRLKDLDVALIDKGYEKKY